MKSKERIGHYIKCSDVGGEHYSAYMPQKLPPNPPLDMEMLYPLLDQANTALGRLDGTSMVLPDPALFLYMYVRREAVLSSQIEGTRSSLSDLLLLETNGTPNGVSLPTVLRALAVLESIGIIKETTDKGRHKVFAYREYIDIPSQGTEPFPE